MRALRTAWRGTKPPTQLGYDQSHPLAKGLVGLWLSPDHGQMPLRDLVTGRPTTPAGGGGDQADSPYGLVQTYDGSAKFHNIDASSLVQTDVPITIVALCCPTNLSAFRGIATTAVAPTNYAGAVFVIDTSGALYIWYGDNTGQTNSNRRGIFSANGAVTAGKWQVLGGTIRAATDMSLYVDGVSLGGTTFGTGGAIAFPAGGSIGSAENGGGTNRFLGPIALLGIWNRDFSDAEHAEIARDPFGLFTVRPKPIVKRARTPYETEVLADTPHLALFTRESSGNLRDSSTNQYIAVAHGSPTYRNATGFPGAPYAIGFDGSSYFGVADTAALEITGDMTIEALIGITSHSAQQYIVAKGSTEYALYIHDGGSSGQIGILKIGIGGVAQFSYTVPTDGVVRHFFVMRSGSTYQLYVNNVLTDTQTAGTSIGTSGSELEIGAGVDSSPGSRKALSGTKVGSISYYNTALSSARRTAHYIAATGGVVVADTGATISDTLVHSVTRALADTGSSVSDATPVRGIVRLLADTGATVGEILRGGGDISLSDTGATVSGVLTRPLVGRVLADTGATVAGSVAAFAVRSRSVADTGATVSDAILPRVARVIVSAGATVADALFRTFHYSRTLSDIGAVVTDSVTSHHLIPVAPPTPTGGGFDTDVDELDVLENLMPELADAPEVAAPLDALATELGRVSANGYALLGKMFAVAADDFFGTLAMWEELLALPVNPPGVPLMARQAAVAAATRRRHVPSARAWGALLDEIVGVGNWSWTYTGPPRKIARFDASGGGSTIQKDVTDYIVGMAVEVDLIVPAATIAAIGDGIAPSGHGAAFLNMAGTYTGTTSDSVYLAHPAGVGTPLRYADFDDVFGPHAPAANVDVLADAVQTIRYDAILDSYPTWLALVKVDGVTVKNWTFPHFGIPGDPFGVWVGLWDNADPGEVLYVREVRFYDDDNNVTFREDFSSDSFATNGWTVTGSGASIIDDPSPPPTHSYEIAITVVPGGYSVGQIAELVRRVTPAHLEVTVS